jgi:hypothetical protein
MPQNQKAFLEDNFFDVDDEPKL